MTWASAVTFWLAILGLSWIGAEPRDSALSWSPDGQWVVYSITHRSASDRPGVPDLLFSAEPSASTPASTPSLANATTKLWATRADDMLSVPLAEGRGLFTAAVWNPAGTLLVYGRLQWDSSTSARLEILSKEGLSLAPRVLMVQHLPREDADRLALDLAAAVPAWSPDGRLIAVPRVHGAAAIAPDTDRASPPALDLAILRADTGRIVKILENGILPAWSPDGSRLAFHREQGFDGLCVVSSEFGAIRELVQTGHATQPPHWSRDGKNLLVVRYRGAPRPGELASEQAELLNVLAEGSRADRVKVLVPEAAGAESPLGRVSFVLDPENQDLFFSVSGAKSPSRIFWCLPRDGWSIVHDQFNPFDLGVGVGALSIGSTAQSRWLALRIGRPEPTSLPALCNPEARRVQPLAPDDAASQVWLDHLIVTIKGIVNQLVPPPIMDSTPTTRPTWLPAPGELATNDERWMRLRRLARHGVPLLQRLNQTAAANPRASDTPDNREERLNLAKLGLILPYLQGEYAEALDAWNTLEPLVDSPRQRVTLLHLLVQIHLGRSDPVMARETLEFLRSIEPERTRIVETTPMGPLQTILPDPRAVWRDYLGARIATLESRSPDPLESLRPKSPPLPDSDPPQAPIFNGVPVEMPFQVAPPPRPGLPARRDGANAEPNEPRIRFRIEQIDAPRRRDRVVPFE